MKNNNMSKYSYPRYEVESRSKLSKYNHPVYSLSVLVLSRVDASLQAQEAY